MGEQIQKNQLLTNNILYTDEFSAMLYSGQLVQSFDCTNNTFANSKPGDPMP